MHILMRAKFGSHLYGTNTATSDHDYKGVFMPELEDILMGRIPRHYTDSTKTKHSDVKNTPYDIDSEYYSLHYYLKLACEGETFAIDMVHTPPDKLITTSNIWSEIYENRWRFYTKSMRAAVGYARGQAAKYGCKGSRLSAAKEVIDCFKDHIQTDHTLEPDSTTLKDIWDDLPSGEHIEKVRNDTTGVCMYIVCGKQMVWTSKLSYNLPIIEKFYEHYGARAKQAASNENIDWKAVSHALRVCYQMLEIIETGDLKYPLANADFLILVKLGAFKYSYIGPLLDTLIDELNDKSAASSLPDKVDTKWWDNFLYVKVLDYHILETY